MKTKPCDRKRGDRKIRFNQSEKVTETEAGMSNDMMAAVNAIHIGKLPVTHSTLGESEIVEMEPDAKDTDETLDHLRNEKMVAAGVGV